MFLGGRRKRKRERRIEDFFLGWVGRGRGPMAMIGEVEWSLFCVKLEWTERRNFAWKSSPGERRT